MCKKKKKIRSNTTTCGGKPSGLWERWALTVCLKWQGDSTVGRNPPGLQTASLILHSSTWIFHKTRSIRGGTAEFITPTRTATHASDRLPCLLGWKNSPGVYFHFIPGALEHYWVSPKSRGKYCQRHFLWVKRVGVTRKSCISSNWRNFLFYSCVCLLYVIQGNAVINFLLKAHY